LAGSGIALATLSVWLVMLWTGWTLVFVAADDAITTQVGVSASITERAWFAGYMLSTVGSGTIGPTQIGWRLAADLASFTGLFLATLSITYLVTVVQSASDRRQLARLVHGLGDDVADTAVALPDVTPSGMDDLTARVLQLAERHLAFPILHYFHASKPSVAAPLALARLDEGLALVEFIGPPSDAAHLLARQRLRGALDHFWETVHEHGAGQQPVPAAPSSAADVARRLEADPVDPQRLSAAYADVARRRRMIASFVRDDGWDWPDDGR
jgi:hypothetical protein